MTDYSINLIVALLPLTAIMLVSQVNPYHALVIRGILGAMSALIYALLGAADVALTEALVGTLLSVMLFAVAVRSSLVMRLGVLEGGAQGKGAGTQGAPDSTGVGETRLRAAAGYSAYSDLLTDLRTVLNKYHLRLELVPYPDAQALHQALMDREIHASCVEPTDLNRFSGGQSEPQSCQLLIRVRRLYDVLQSDLLVPPNTSLTYISVSEADLAPLAPIASEEVTL